MAWYPKAIRKEVRRHRTRRNHRGGRVCLHVAVSNADSLYGYFNQAGKPTSHFYVRKSGVIEQYVDTQYCAPANLEGNDSLISFETEGGVTNANSEPWTVAQIQAMAECLAWLNRVEGVPLHVMSNSRSTSTGIGYHKQGVDPYRVTNGERWSSAYGKICPGQGKINQIPGLVNKAKTLVTGVPATPPPVQPPKEWDEMATKEEVQAAVYAGNSQYAIDFWVKRTGTGTALIRRVNATANVVTAISAAVAALGSKMTAEDVADDAVVASLRAQLATLQTTVDELKAELEQEIPDPPKA